ncbi:MAG TPA: farnesyl diphosphate synthase [Candidatus Acidoferrales bacterium]|nr:farnesyl diphosphate synthase [Candidatus Acidoferrales bacterium]
MERKIKTRTLGTQGLAVSSLGPGRMDMSGFCSTPNGRESITTLHRAPDLGATFLDTADVYGPWSEVLRHFPILGIDEAMRSSLRQKTRCLPRHIFFLKYRRMSAKSQFDLNNFLATRTEAVNRALDKFLPSEKTKPATIHKAMRYSLFAGGKRMRPALCLAAAEACGGKAADALPLACAVECIHTYSLIHDDLPAMDNDDFRRGKPTNHKVFGDGIAVLAGDALLTQAFEIGAQAKGWPRYPHRTIILELAKASGSLQLVAGQVADLEGEGKKISASELRYIHERKTSALLCCSVRLGGMSANCTPTQLKALTDFGYHVGLAFQVIDDILDVTQTSEQLGKTAGKDTAAQKATYPAIVGLEKSRKIAEQLTAKAFAALKLFKGRAVALEALAEFLLKRDK